MHFASQDYYNALLRIVTLLQNDFPDFLVENHAPLTNSLSPNFVQLKNLILNSIPSHTREPPSPLTAGMQVLNIDDIRDTPPIRGDYTTGLKDAGILKVLDSLLGSAEPDSDGIDRLVSALQSAPQPSVKSFVPMERYPFALLQALVLHVAVKGTAEAGPTMYSKESAPLKVLEGLVRELPDDFKAQLIEAVVNQLRFPNTHTYYFVRAIVDLFSIVATDDNDGMLVQELIMKELMERVAIQRPHPWGLLVTLLELHKNAATSFWGLPFIKSPPEVCAFYP
jgi:CCR4-NOT transcription complex subunit 1